MKVNRSWFMALLCMLPVLMVWEASAQETVHLQLLTVTDGLSQNGVTAIIQDHRGLMWFGTQDGLNCFDGHRFTVYKTQRSDKNSLSSNFITALCEDQNGNLWVGTRGGGLSRLDSSRSSFLCYLNDTNLLGSLPDNSIMALCLDLKGTLWVGTSNGLYSLEKGQSSFVPCPVRNSEQPQGTSHNYISALIVDRVGNLWVGTYRGLDRRDALSGQFENFTFQDTSGQRSQYITSLQLSPTGTLWVCSTNGIDRFTPETECFERFLAKETPQGAHFQGRLLDSRGVLYVSNGADFFLFDTVKRQRVEWGKNLARENSLQKDALLSAYEDRDNKVWLGTARQGAALVLPHIFDHYFSNTTDKTSSTNNSIHSFAEDDQGRVWIGGSEGLTRWDRQSKTFERVNFISQQTKSSLNDRIYGIIPDPSGKLWLATSLGGICHLDPVTGSFLRITRDPENLTRSLTHAQVRCLIRDRHGDLWAGCNHGLNHLSSDGKVIGQYLNRPEDPDSMSNNGVLSLLEDRQGTLWVGTFGGGLNRLKKDQSGFVIYRHQPRKTDGPSSNIILALHEDSQGNLWLGTSAGLDRYSQKTGEFRNYSEQDGLPNNTIYGILEDDQGRLWLSTNRGLCRFEPRTGKITSYGLSHGVQDLEFNRGASFKCRDGSLLFGGVNGFNHFEPRKIADNEQVPDLLITRVEVFPRRLFLMGGVESGQELILEPGDALINLEFAVLNYVEPVANRYAYKIEGLQNDWIDLGKTHNLSLSSLPYGQHLFRVKGTNGNGIWNEIGATLVLVVRPPFYWTWWFLTLMGLLLLTGAYQLGATHRKRVAGRIQYEGELKAMGTKLGLSVREQEIVLLVVAGKSNKEIENQLFIAESTVRNHIYSVYRKLGVKNRPQLVSYFKNLKI